MPCYLITIHTYRSWMPDHRRGFIQEDKGIQPPNPALAQAYHWASSDPPYLMDELDQRFVIGVVRDVCAGRGWDIHAIACESTHVHILLSWSTDESWLAVRSKTKNIISLELGKYHGLRGRKWLSKGGSRKRVKDQKHYDYLVHVYLPKHRGAQWYEKDQSGNR